MQQIKGADPIFYWLLATDYWLLLAPAEGRSQIHLPQ